MSLHSVIFQHEALNHFIRAYLFYSHDSIKKFKLININIKKTYCYYPKQKQEDIKQDPNYLKKFILKMTDKELKELQEPSTLDYKQYLDDQIDNNKETDLNDSNNSDIEMGDNYEIKKNEIKEDEDNGNIFNSNLDNEDEGNYYERQLFTDSYESKLTKYNFLQE